MTWQRALTLPGWHSELQLPASRPCKINFCCVSPLHCRILLQQPEWTETDDKGKDREKNVHMNSFHVIRDAISSQRELKLRWNMFQLLFREGGTADLCSLGGRRPGQPYGRGTTSPVGFRWAHTCPVSLVDAPTLYHANRDLLCGLHAKLREGN